MVKIQSADANPYPILDNHSYCYKLHDATISSYSYSYLNFSTTSNCNHRSIAHSFFINTDVSHTANRT